MKSPALMISGNVWKQMGCLKRKLFKNIHNYLLRQNLQTKEEPLSPDSDIFPKRTVTQRGKYFEVIPIEKPLTTAQTRLDNYWHIFPIRVMEQLDS